MGGGAAQMTQEQFETAVEQTRIALGLREAARRVLVDGEPGAEVAREIGMTRQQLSRSVQRIRQTAGLVTISVTVPAEHRPALEAWVIDHGGSIE